MSLEYKYIKLMVEIVEEKDSNATKTSWYKIVEMGFIGNKLLQSEIHILPKATSEIFSLIQ